MRSQGVPWRDKATGLEAHARRWWGQRAPRERVLLSIFGVLAVVTVLIIGVWRPIQEARAQAREEIRTYALLTAQMRAAGPDAIRRAALQSNSGSASLADSAAAAGLGIRRIEPNGSHTQVALEDAPFALVIDWLDRVERDTALRAVDVRMVRRPAPGVVNAQITLAAG